MGKSGCVFCDQGLEAKPFWGKPVHYKYFPGYETRMPCTNPLKKVEPRGTDAIRRIEICAALESVTELISGGCSDYLKVYSAWDEARKAVDNFLDNPDWLEEWVNERAAGSAEAEAAESPGNVEGRPA